MYFTLKNKSVMFMLFLITVGNSRNAKEVRLKLPQGDHQNV